MQNNRYFDSSVWLYISKGINVPLALLLSIIIVRYLTPTEYGSYKIILSIGTALTLIASLGIDTSLARYIPEYIEKKSFTAINRLVLACFIIRFTAVFVVLFISNLLGDIYFDFFNFTTFLKSWYLLICLLLLISQLHSTIGKTLLGAYLEIRKNSLIQIIRSVLLVLFLGIVVYYNLGFIGFLYGLVTAEVLIFSIYALFAIKIYTANCSLEKINPKSPPLEIKRLLKFSFFSYVLAGTAVFRNLAVDNLIISHYLDMKQVGIYAFAVSLITLVNSVNPGAMLKSVFNYYFVRKYTETKDVSTLIYGSKLIVKLSSFVIIPCFLILSVLGEEIVINIYSPKYLASLPIIYCLSFFFAANCFVHGVGFIFTTLELLHLRIYANVFSVYNLIMDIVLVQWIGILGVAVATGTAVLFTVIYYYIVLKYYAKIKLEIPVKAVAKVVLNSLIMGAMLFFSKQFIDNVLELLVFILLAFSIYLYISYLNKPFDDRDRDQINKIIGKRIWQF